ncbi:MAG TPA: LptF/LptG family permease [Planctomycetaceae bacterium]|nr:LptF/LptG family permease [Planctomycetaceae bacterium]
MLIFDRYVLRLFSKIMVICFASLVGLYLLIDAVGKLDDLLELGEATGNLWGVVVDFYAGRIFLFFDQVSALLALLATIFTVTWLEKNNELAATQSLGISRWRIVKPLVIAACLVSLVSILNRELIIPNFRSQLTRTAQNWDGKNPRAVRPRHDTRTDILIGGKFSYAKDQQITSPNFRLHTPIGEFRYRLVAERARYLEPSQQRPGGYLLTQVSDPENLAELDTAYLQDQAIIWSPKDTDWLKEGECFVTSNVHFDQLTAGNTWHQYTSTAQLIRELRNDSIRHGTNVRVTMHRRLVKPILDMTLMFLALPLILQRRKKNLFLAAGSCFMVVMFFYLVVIASHAFGNHGFLLSPALAAWFPMFVFIPIAYALSGALRS